MEDAKEEAKRMLSRGGAKDDESSKKLLLVSTPSDDNNKFSSSTATATNSGGGGGKVVAGGGKNTNFSTSFGSSGGGAAAAAGGSHRKFDKKRASMTAKNTVMANPCVKFLKSLQKETWLLVITVAAIIIGVTLGLSLRAGTTADNPWTKRQLSYLKFPGELFLRMLQMLILPLIVTSIVSSLAQMNMKTAGRLGLFTMAYYFATTGIAVILGIILVNVINPGGWSQGYKPKDLDEEKAPCLSTAVDTILDLIRNLFPENIITSCTHSTKTCTNYENRTTRAILPKDMAFKLTPEQLKAYDAVPVTGDSKGMNILGMIIFSMVLGIVISIMEEEGQVLRQFFKGFESAMMTIISLVIWYAPMGIIFLTAYQIVQMDDPTKELYRLTGYMITVMLGLFIHGVIILPTIFFFCTRRNPFKFVYGMLPALLTALGTSSSSATLPLTIKCCEENNGVDPRVSRFVLPLGATINMDGTALYEAVAALYIAQVLDRPMSLGDIILISLTATLASIGAAGIPQAGIVTMIMVLIAVGLPSNYFILIIPVDWFLDRFRTLTNVHGDSLGTGVVNHFCKNFLKKMDSEVHHVTRRHDDDTEDFKCEVEY